MKIGQVASVGVSKNNKPYGRLANGTAIFGNKDLVLKAGAYVIYNETFQTQDAEGKELENPIPVNVVASIWATKTEAIAAKVEDRLLAIEEDAYVAQATKKLEKEFSLDNIATTA